MDHAGGRLNAYRWSENENDFWEPLLQPVPDWLNANFLKFHLSRVTVPALSGSGDRLLRAFWRRLGGDMVGR